MPPIAPTLHRNHFILPPLFRNPLASFPPSYYGNFLTLSPPQPLSLASTATARQVTTAPVEYTSSTPEFDLDSEISRLRSLISKLSAAGNLAEKHRVIGKDVRVRRFFESTRGEFGRVLDSFELYLVKCVVAAGQEHVVGCYGGEDEVALAETERGNSALKSALYALVEMIERWDMVGEGVGERNVGGSRGLVGREIEAFDKLLRILKDLETFYDCIGGILG